MKRFAIVGALSLVALGTAFAQSPGGSSAFGKTLGEWMLLYHTWAFGGDQADHEGDMVFLPDMSMGTDDDWEFLYDEDTRTGGWSGHLSVTLKPGEKFAWTIAGVIGEEYEDGSEDAPDSQIVLDLIAAIQLFHTDIYLDGKLILSSEDDDYEDHWYDVQYFDEPIPYAATKPWGATAATFITGYGMVHHPLTKGVHTLYMRNQWYKDEIPEFFLWDEDDEFDSFFNELTLTVTVTK